MRERVPIRLRGECDRGEVSRKETQLHRPSGWEVDQSPLQFSGAIDSPQVTQLGHFRGYSYQTHPHKLNFQCVLLVQSMVWDSLLDQESTYTLHCLVVVNQQSFFSLLASTPVLFCIVLVPHQMVLSGQIESSWNCSSTDLTNSGFTFVEDNINN